MSGEKIQAIFEQAVVRADSNPEFQKYASYMITMGTIDVNYSLQYEGTQSGKGNESSWIELLDGNYLSLAITRQNFPLASLLLLSGCDPKKSVRFIKHSQGKSDPPTALSQEAFASLIDPGLAKLVRKFL